MKVIPEMHCACWIGYRHFNYIYYCIFILQSNLIVIGDSTNMLVITVSVVVSALVVIGIVASLIIRKQMR
jgi:hypothetical protein